MPGIAGIITQNPRLENAGAIQNMVDCMVHERFYRAGTYVHDRLGLWTGWVCHEGSFSDCLPVWNEKRDICLVFSGEHFADRTDIEQLRAAGHERSHDTAGYLVHLYEEHGANFFGLLNGMFSGVLIDLREDEIVLFNDRYGLGRLYYHECADAFYFASEAKAILKVRPQLRQLDMQGFAEFFSCGCVMQNRTLFSGISLVPAGSAWTFGSQGGLRKKNYFNKEVWEKQPPLSQADYYDKLKGAFTRILPRYFDGKQPVTLSLTGGLDSRMIIARAPCKPFTLQCHTFGGLYRDPADVEVAQRVAKVAQQQHEVIRLNRAFFSEFPVLAMRSIYLTDGAMSVSGAVGLFVNRMAREIAPVRLTGNYGSEILRRLVAFKVMPLCEAMFNRDFLPHLRNAAAVYEAEREDNRCSFIAFKQVPWHHYARYALEQSQLTIRSPYLDNDLVAVAYQAPAELLPNLEFAGRLIADGNPALASFATDRGPLARHGVLGKVRALFQEFTFKAEYAYDYGMPQWLTRVDHALAPLHLERMFLGRHKYYHFRIWYRNELSHYVKEVLLDPRTLSRPYLNARCVEELVTAHVRGSRNHTLDIHGLLTSEFIQRQLIEQK